MTTTTMQQEIGRLLNEAKQIVGDGLVNRKALQIIGIAVETVLGESVEVAFNEPTAYFIVRRTVVFRAKIADRRSIDLIFSYCLLAAINEKNIFAVIRWSVEDLVKLFPRYHIEFSEENIKKFVSSYAPASLKERSIEEGRTIIGYLLCDLLADETLKEMVEEADEEAVQ